MTAAPRLLLPLSREELALECRAKENDLLVCERQLDAIAAALWTDNPEAPESYRVWGEYEPSEIVDGIRSLHELTDRLTAEIEQLRGAPCK